MTEKRTEADVARLVVAELNAQGFTTYEEVVCGGKRADIVGVRGPVHAIVEVKATMSLRLLDQVAEWRGAAHVRIAAVGKGRIGPAVRQWCQHEGVGLWVADFREVHESIAPRLHRRAVCSIRRHLRVEQQSGAFSPAGTNGGRYYTPFAATCRALREVVRANPGVTLKQALSEIPHHYASSKTAMGALPKLIRQGVVNGVSMDEASRPLRLYPVAPALEMPA